MIERVGFMVAEAFEALRQRVINGVVQKQKQIHVRERRQSDLTPLRRVETARRI